MTAARVHSGRPYPRRLPAPPGSSAAEPDKYNVQGAHTRQGAHTESLSSQWSCAIQMLSNTKAKLAAIPPTKARSKNRRLRWRRRTRSMRLDVMALAPFANIDLQGPCQLLAALEGGPGLALRSAPKCQDHWPVARRATCSRVCTTREPHRLHLRRTPSQRDKWDNSSCPTPAGATSRSGPWPDRPARTRRSSHLERRRARNPPGSRAAEACSVPAGRP